MEILTHDDLSELTPGALVSFETVTGEHAAGIVKEVNAEAKTAVLISHGEHAVTFGVPKPEPIEEEVTL